MGGGFFAYLQRLEMLAFFSGYPLIYLFIQFIAGSPSLKNKTIRGFTSLLPSGYALVGTLYLGLQLRNLYPGFTLQNIEHAIPQPFLNIWGLLSILFWIPVISKKPVLSMLHSLVFFFIIIGDLISQLTGVNSDRNILKNDMRIYSVSILLNLAAFIFVALITFSLNFRKKKRKS